MTAEVMISRCNRKDALVAKGNEHLPIGYKTNGMPFFGRHLL